MLTVTRGFCEDSLTTSRGFGSETLLGGDEFMISGVVEFENYINGEIEFVSNETED